jgi:hypothetical protein
MSGVASDSSASGGPSDEGGSFSASDDAAPDSTAGAEPDSSKADGPFDSMESGASDVVQDAQKCTGTLSNIGIADFRISFTLTTIQSGLVALVNQRGACGFGVFWDLRMSGGFIFVELDDTSYTSFTTVGARVNDGLPHEVMVSRSAETVVASIDGVASASSSAPESFGNLTPVTSGKDPCIGYPNDSTVALVGTMSNLCVTSP